MAYKDFTFPEVLDRLGLTLREEGDFAGVPPADPGSWLPSVLARGRHLGGVTASEKARSEFVIAPVLVRVLELTSDAFGLHSGVSFDVDRERGLNGFCDFILTRDRRQSILAAPVLAVAEAKPHVPPTGFGQCISAMVAAREFNARSGPTRPVFGCATSGTLWSFLRLDDDQITLDPTEYVIDELGKILGILKYCVTGP